MADPKLRPLGFGEILDLAFTLYRRHFGTFFLTALLPSVPVALFWIYIGMAAGSGTPEEQSAVMGAGMLLVVIYSLFAAVLVWGALVQDASRAVTGEPVSLGGGYRRALSRFLPLLGAGIVAGFLIWIGLLFLLIPGVLLAIVFFAVPQAVVLEEEGPFSALGRSREIARGGWLRIFGILFITWLIVAIPSGTLGLGLGTMAALEPAAADSMASGGVTASLYQAASVVVSALTTPFLITSLVVLYYDRRIRGEGLDLEVAAEEIGPTV